MTTIKGCDRNHKIFGLCFTAKDWADQAMSCGGIIPGGEGFEQFKSGDFHHTWSYKHISKASPKDSPTEALEEMARFREILVQDIYRTASLLDEQIKRLEKMDMQANEVARL